MPADLLASRTVVPFGTFTTTLFGYVIFILPKYFVRTTFAMVINTSTNKNNGQYFKVSGSTICNTGKASAGSVSRMTENKY